MDTSTQLWTPSATEMAQGIWSWFWPFFKFFVIKLWPLWLMFGILLLVKYLVMKALNKRFEKKNKKCPECLEWVPIEAKKCKYCTATF